MKLFTTVLAHAGFASIVAAYDQNYGYIGSGGTYGPAPNETVQAYFRAAGQNANATGQVSFQRTNQGVSRNITEQWTWEVDISEPAIPNSSYLYSAPIGNYSNHLRLTNTQYFLRWPGSGSNASYTLNDYLAQRNQTLSFGVAQLDLYANITSRPTYANGSCAGLLGETCASVLKNYPAAGQSLYNQPGCENTLRGPGGLGETTKSSVSPTPRNATNATSIDVDNPLSYIATGLYPTGDTTFYDRSVSSLQLLVLTFGPPLDGSSSEFESEESYVLCQVIDKSKDVQGAATTAVGKPGLLFMMGMMAIATTVFMLFQ